MAMISRGEMLALATAVAVSVAMPLVLLRPGTEAPSPQQHRVLPPLVAHRASPPSALFQRSLFSAGEAAAGADEAPADAPALLGIAGRLGADAIALVRTSDGTTRSLGIGDSVDGWRLESLAIDAAFFVRGGEKVRVALPAG